MGVIVVGVADTATSQAAADAAAVIAKAMGEELCVVTAFEDDDVEVITAGSESFRVSTRGTAEAFAQRTVERLRLAQGITARSVARQGKPAEVILEIASEVDARMVVVGNVRMQGIGRVLGSVANTVAHAAPCDVYIVKTS